MWDITSRSRLTPRLQLLLVVLTGLAGSPGGEVLASVPSRCKVSIAKTGAALLSVGLSTVSRARRVIASDGCQTERWGIRAPAPSPTAREVLSVNYPAGLAQQCSLRACARPTTSHHAARRS